MTRCEWRWRASPLRSTECAVVNRANMVLLSVLQFALIGCSARPTPNVSLATSGSSTNERCDRTIFNYHGVQTHAHHGVDFSLCEGDHVIAVGDGHVLMVHHSSGADADAGDTVVVDHGLSGVSLMLMYVHLEHVSVRKGDLVKRGERIGDAWMPLSFPWQRHVHVEMLGSEDRRETLDPLKYLRGCASKVSSREFIYPVSC
jgi:murein DD-endopeptidase MepM/ murein hydrolase activator NlpD